MKTRYFTNRDLVIMAVLVAISGVFQLLWAHLCFNITFLGPLTALFTNAGFMVWCFLAVYFVPKPGAATLVKTIAAIIEVIGGNPVGLVAIAYGAIEGLAVDLAYLAFRRKMSVNMMIVGALFSQLLTAPIDFIRDAVSFQFMAMLVYWSPGIAGTVFTGWISWLAINGLRKIGLRNTQYPNNA